MTPQQQAAPESSELLYLTIGDLPSAKRLPVTVEPQQKVIEAITKMLTNDFSQLPVMSGYTVKGMIIWETIGSRLALGRLPLESEARECMVSHQEVRADKPLFDAIDEIVTNQYVLIRDSTNKISGIVTTSDLSLKFRQLAEPFLLLREIENNIREIIKRGEFTQAELQASSEPSATGKNVESVKDLNLGDYEQLLQDPERWSRLKIKINRKIFIDKLDRVRRIRNEVMHFNRKVVSDVDLRELDEDLRELRNFSRFLRRLWSFLPSAY
jgi:CBS domain-containing protein